MTCSTVPISHDTHRQHDCRVAVIRGSSIIIKACSLAGEVWEKVRWFQRFSLSVPVTIRNHTAPYNMVLLLPGSLPSITLASFWSSHT